MKLRGEQLNIDEQSMIDAVTPFLETAASNMPIVSEFNNGMVFFCGKDIYGNQADVSDKGLVVICVMTKGAAHNAKYIVKEVFKGGAQIVNETGEWGTRLIQSIKTYRNQNQKQRQTQSQSQN